MRNEALLTVAAKAANEWRGTDAYHQAAELIDALVAEVKRIDDAYVVLSHEHAWDPLPDFPIGVC